MSKILLINGPNLGLLGKRKPAVYGQITLKEIVLRLEEISLAHNLSLEAFQSNCEGELVSFLNDKFISLSQSTEKVRGIIINPGAYTHTSIALRDALEVFCDDHIPLIEVHLSNIFAREDFRHHSFISDIAKGVVCGLDAFGYEVALLKIIQMQTT